MRPSDAWATLGIEPTDDVRAIRVAYATRLKAFDPDSDPRAFIALREARDLTLRIAGGTARAAMTTSEPEQHTAPSPEPKAIPQAERHARELQAMFHADRDPTMINATPQERQTMLAHWQGIVADPQLQEVGFFAQLEQWAIGLIALHLPLSDPLIIPATELFGWTASDNMVTQSREVAAISFRYGWLRYIEDIQEADHPHHALWEELRTPAGPGAKRGRVGPARIRDLLHIVRTMRPDLENCFDSARVALWDLKQNPEPELDPNALADADHTGRNLRIKFAIAYAILAILIVSFMVEDRKPPQTESMDTIIARMRAEEKEYKEQKYRESFNTELENASQ